MWHVPIAFVTGHTGKNVKSLLNHAQMLFKQSRQRVTTGQLNSLLRKALEHNPPPLHRNRRPKIYYATQVGIQPPTIVALCNDPRAFLAQLSSLPAGCVARPADVWRSARSSSICIAAGAKRPTGNDRWSKRKTWRSQIDHSNTSP